MLNMQGIELSQGRHQQDCLPRPWIICTQSNGDSSQQHQTSQAQGHTSRHHCLLCHRGYTVSSSSSPVNESMPVDGCWLREVVDKCGDESVTNACYDRRSWKLAVDRDDLQAVQDVAPSGIHSSRMLQPDTCSELHFVRCNMPSCCGMSHQGTCCSLLPIVDDSSWLLLHTCY